VDLPFANAEEKATLAAQVNPNSRRPVIGMATRFAAEKGVEVLLKALPIILEKHPNALVLYTGPYRNVVGEEAYLRRLLPLIQRYQAEGHWKFLDYLLPPQLAAYYANLDVLTVPSLNSTESFGMVQIEAMIQGTPVVASDRPGVRRAVEMTGMGEITQTGNPASLAEGILKVLENPGQYRGDPAAIAHQFSAEANAMAYERLFETLLREKS
jgi:glycosyltransferase involved in cell wall biosynthesis